MFWRTLGYEVRVLTNGDESADGFWVCPEHGDLWWVEDVRVDSSLPVCVEHMEPLIEGLAVPLPTDEARCPLCNSWVRRELRPRVRVLAPAD